jgi:hypothetical protein
VRQRVGLAAISAPTLDDVLRERHLELAMEGDRYFDLIRTGLASQVLGGKGFVAGKHDHYPIPQEQIDLSDGQLSQNPGY